MTASLVFSASRWDGEWRLAAIVPVLWERVRVAEQVRADAAIAAAGIDGWAVVVDPPEVTGWTTALRWYAKDPDGGTARAVKVVAASGDFDGNAAGEAALNAKLQAHQDRLDRRERRWTAQGEDAFAGRGEVA